MNVLGLKIIGHDTGAALISCGRVIAISEERLNRVKHSLNIFPMLSIFYCLDEFKLKPEDIDLIVIDQIGKRTGVSTEAFFRRNAAHIFSKTPVEVINHHDAHAASAFFCSPFEEAAVFVCDGAGEKVPTHYGISAVETETLYRGKDNRLYQLQKTAHPRRGKKYLHSFGIGKLYTLVSETYIGLGPFNEGKLMGLAPYGSDSVFNVFPAREWFTERGGHIVCNPHISFQRNSFTGGFSALKLKVGVFYQKLRKRLWGIPPRISFLTPPYMFKELILPRPPRRKESLPDEYYASVAYAAQKVLEEVVCQWGEKLRDMTGLNYLCVAGGVGLNIDANRQFIDKVGFKNIFIQPAATDAGIPLGCVLYGYHTVLNQPRFYVMRSAELGRRYSDREVISALDRFLSEIEFKKTKDIAAETARLIAEGYIIGWFYGGGEYGPRALGQRSILCDARLKDGKDILNTRVKHREWWRPFAASVLREKVKEWFDLPYESPFMLLAAAVVPDKRKKIPSVVHVDNTCRIQTVTKEANGRYYDLINEFHKLTGVPLILNTSFNLAGDPIIEKPEDALECFLKTKMDYLVIEDYLISKKS